jgi:hypothetical protein
MYNVCVFEQAPPEMFEDPSMAAAIAAERPIAHVSSLSMGNALRMQDSKPSDVLKLEPPKRRKLR